MRKAAHATSAPKIRQTSTGRTPQQGCRSQTPGGAVPAQVLAGPS